MNDAGQEEKQGLENGGLSDCKKLGALRLAIFCQSGRYIDWLNWSNCGSQIPRTPFRVFSLSALINFLSICDSSIDRLVALGHINDVRDGPERPAMRVSQLTGRRTNSLGWAKSDCHSCVSRSRHCDRRRPRCSPCLAEGTICSGYVQQLDWERGAAKKGKRRAKEPSPKVKGPDLESPTFQLPTPSSFIFVDHEDALKRSRRKLAPRSQARKSRKWK